MNNFTKIWSIIFFFPIIVFSQDSIYIHLENVDFIEGTASVKLSTPETISNISLNFSCIQIDEIWGGLVDELAITPFVGMSFVNLQMENNQIILPGDYTLFEIKFNSNQNSICIYNGAVFLDGIQSEFVYLNDCEYEEDVEWGEGWQGWEDCAELEENMCYNIPICELDSDGSCVDSESGWGMWNDEDYECEALLFYECNFPTPCEWDFDNSICQDIEEVECSELLPFECNFPSPCVWNVDDGLCEDIGEFENWNTNFCTDLNIWNCENYPACILEDGECSSIFYDDSENYFSDLLNGYFEEYLDYSDSTNNGIIAYVTIETSDDLDFGDDIGVFDLEGGSNFGDCDNNVESVLVGNATWQDGPLTIPIYGHINDCDNGGFQLPGFIENNPIEIRVWDESESEEYTLVINREELLFGEEYILINNVEMTVLSNSEIYIQNFKLDFINNYPNPFNPHTTFEFNIQNSMDYKISIINVLGKEIEIIHNGWINSGNHSITWNGEHLKSGIYFCKLSSLNGVLTKKIILLK